MTSDLLPPLRVKPLGGWILTVFTAWLAIAAAEVAMAHAAAGAPSVAGTCVELGLLLAVAVVHAFTLGRLPLMGGPLTPGALMLGITALSALSGRGLVQRHYPLSPGDLLLLLVAVGALGEWLERRAPRLAPVVAVLAAPAWVALHSLEIGYYLGGRSTAIETAAAAWPWMAAGIGGAAVVAALAPVVAPAAAGLAALLLSFNLAPSAPPRDLTADPRPNILLITVDTLRADEAGSMETYRRLAEGGLAFTDALAPSGWTLPSMGTIVTGLYPQTHGAYRLSDKWPSHGSLRPDKTLITEALHRAGYGTAVVCTNPNLAEGFGFRRGVDHFVNLFKDPPTIYFGLSLIGRGPALEAEWPSPYDGGLIVDEALRWLEHPPAGPFFLWVHTLDNHLPYYHVRIPAESPLFPTFGPTLGKQLNVQMLRMGRLWYHAPIRDALRGLYREEIAYTDHHLMRLLNAMEARGLLANTAVVFTSDHGEEFLDHGSFEHGHTLYEELVHVPLVLKLPGKREGAVRGDPVGLIDLFPTLAALAGVPLPEALPGQDLRQVAPADRLRFLHGSLYNHHMEGVVDGDLKLLRLEGGARTQLFERSTGEAADLAAERPEAVEALKGKLDALKATTSEEPELDVEGLRALGYME